MSFGILLSCNNMLSKAKTKKEKTPRRFICTSNTVIHKIECATSFLFPLNQILTNDVHYISYRLYYIFVLFIAKTTIVFICNKLLNHLFIFELLYLIFSAPTISKCVYLVAPSRVGCGTMSVLPIFETDKNRGIFDNFCC